MNKNLRAMIEGAITVALSIVILLLMIYTPLVLFIFFVVPIPYMVFAARHSWRSAISVGVVSLLLTILFGLVLMTPIVVYGWAVGLVLGISFARKDSGVQTILLGSVTILGLFLLALVVTVLVFQMNPIDEIIRMTVDLFEQSNQILSNYLGDATSGINFAEMLKLYFPSILIINSIFLGFVNYWIGYGLHKRLGSKPRPFPPLSELRFPRSIIYYYVVALGLALLQAFLKLEWLKMSVLNILPVLDLILSVQGVLFVFFFAKQRKMGKGLPILSIVLLFIPTFTYILKIIGVVDLALNIREKIASRS